MNEYEQAIWNFRVTKPAGHLLDETKLLQELVDLHTPKKPIKTYGLNICGHCYDVEKGIIVVLLGKKKYCPECGGALDWSEWMINQQESRSEK